VPAVPVRPAAGTARDNLQRIGSVDAGMESQLAAQGVTRYAQIAQWSPADVARLEAVLGAAGRIGRENWIEQAQILSRGGDTAYSRDYDRRSAASGSEAAVSAGTGASAAGRGDLGFLRSVRSAAYHGATPLTPAQHPAQFEDLKRIRGIGVLIERRLNQLGVVSYEQIANWTADEIARVSQSLDFKGRIERENWVEQARILASGGATEFSRRVDRGEVETSRYRP
ncbi:MAG TPA: cell envelope biogenesis protein TolA, partial [Hyphomicrobiaceae bacterium]|nr:cell envelope biogenesis protein TolA [Hyphomicrobiaceae bacterium]